MSFLYADDVVFLGDWSEVNAKNLKRIIRCFYLASGLKVNLRKSRVYGVGVNDVEAQEMANILNCKLGKLPFVHLGLPVGANMNLYKHWKLVLDTFRS